jgi:hypothetical protein
MKQWAFMIDNLELCNKWNIILFKIAYSNYRIPHYLILYIDLDSNPKYILSHMRIADNINNNGANANI